MSSFSPVRMLPHPNALILLVSVLVVVHAGDGRAGEIDARGSAVLGWQSEEIARVTSFTPYGPPGRIIDVEQRQCLSGYQFFFDVLDNFAFDLDEPIELELEIDLDTSSRSFRLDYDSGGRSALPLVVDLPARSRHRFHTERMKLTDARFAGDGDFGSDFRIAAQDAAHGKARGDHADITICSVRVRRSFSTPAPRDFGWLNLTIADESGEATPARLGIYDAADRMHRFNSSAVTIEDFSRTGRTMLLPPGTVNWPAGNRQAGYIDGEYRTRLPSGRYSLVATKGLEYRFAKADFRIDPGATLELNVELERWADMPARGWTSGDLHVHVPRRDAADNHALLVQAQAEDVHVVNSLVMGNIARTHFPQRYWGKPGWYGEDRYFLVAGQEDPRTAARGHTVHVNLAAPVRDPARYLSYQRVFQQVARQGGLSGYAHLDRLGAEIGLALDAPFGNVAFLEVLQRGELNTELWFDLLNLGFRVSPAAGSDAPYGARIGDVRSYVRVKDSTTPAEWFDGLAKGRTFATNGPLVEMTVNGSSIGEEIAVNPGGRFHVRAQATINPDIDQLDRLELIEQGQLVKVVRADGGSERLELSYEATAQHGTWFVLRAYGTRQRPGAGGVAAVSAPIYLPDADGRTWKASEVRGIAERFKEDLNGFSQLSLTRVGQLDEWFETEEVWMSDWGKQHHEVQARVSSAKTELDRLIRASEAR